MSNATIKIFLDNSSYYKGRRIHRDPYEVEHTYQYSSDFFVSDIDALTFNDLRIMKSYTCSGETEVDEDYDFIWKGKAHIKTICDILNGNYSYQKFSPASSTDGLKQVSEFQYQISDATFFNKYIRRLSIVKSAECFVDTIIDSYSSAFLNNKIAPDTIIPINYSIELSPFDTSLEIYANEWTYYPGGIVRVFDKFGILLFPNINALILGFFCENKDLFMFGVDNLIPTADIVKSFKWRGYSKVLANKILQYAKDLNVSSDKINWLSSEFNI